MSMGPVSRHLRKKIAEAFGRHSLYTWLDKVPPSHTDLDDLRIETSSRYQEFVQQLREEQTEGKLNYRIIAYDGSYLEMMLTIDEHLSGNDPKPTLVYLPRHDDEDLLQTPLLEVDMAGKRFEQDLTTLVQEAALTRVPQSSIDTFLQNADCSLKDADQWLAEQLEDTEDPLWASLHGLDSITDLVDELLSTTPGIKIQEAMSIDDRAEIVWRYLEIKLGLPANWPPRSQLPTHPRASDLLYVMGSWALCSEFVYDLAISPRSPLLAPLVSLAGPLVEHCKEVSTHLRKQAPEMYENIADETEGFLGEELANIHAKQLGDLDTFRFEEERILDATMAACFADKYDEAHNWAQIRLERASFWLQRSDERRWTWELLLQGSELGIALQTAAPSFSELDSLGQAVDIYVEQYTSIDQKHRHLEQYRYRLLKSNLPKFEDVQRFLDDLRRRYQDWLNALAREFNGLCVREGFLPSDRLQQRHLFEQVVRPITKEADKMAYFLIDGMRYEMAQELLQLLNIDDSTYKLEHRLAELPTITSVGMNLLAPANQGDEIQPIIRNESIKGMQGFGSFQINNPDTRRKAIHDRIGGRTCPKIDLRELLELDTVTLKKKMAGSKILVLHDRSIDKAGEEGIGVQRFDDALRTLRAVWQRLREVGICHFVFTSDHGFLLLDPHATKRQPHGRPIDPSRRHVLSRVAVNHANEVRIPLTQLNYQIDEELHLMMPEDACVFDSMSPVQNYAHGGNTLQERVIPVLTLRHEAPQGSQAEEYVMEADFEPSQSKYHALRVHVSSPKGQQFAFHATETTHVELEIVPSDLPKEDARFKDVFIDLPQHLPGPDVIQEQGILKVPLNQECVILFRLIGSQEVSTRIKLQLPNTKTADLLLPQWLDIESFSNPSSTGLPELPEPTVEDWFDALPDDARKIFTYLNEHGSLSEPEAAGLLGNARKLRRFRVKLDEYSAKVPFTVRIDNVNGTSRLVKVGDKK